MKTLLIIVLFLVTLSQYLKADNIKEPEILNKYSIDRNIVYIVCFDGYKYMLTSVYGGANITQIFKENNNNRSVPVSCK